MRQPANTMVALMTPTLRRRGMFGPRWPTAAAVGLVASVVGCGSSAQVGPNDAGKAAEAGALADGTVEASAEGITDSGDAEAALPEAGCFAAPEAGQPFACAEVTCWTESQSCWGAHDGPPPATPDGSTVVVVANRCEPLPCSCSVQPSCACFTIGPSCSCTEDGGGLFVVCSEP